MKLIVAMIILPLPSTLFLRRRDIIRRSMRWSILPVIVLTRHRRRRVVSMSMPSAALNEVIHRSQTNETPILKMNLRIVRAVMYRRTDVALSISRAVPLP